MQTLPTNLAIWLLALSPIVVVLVLMLGFRWGGSKAGPIGWFVALFVSLCCFGATPRLLAYAQLKAVLLTTHVLYIIWMALVLYNVVNEAGAIAVIGQGIARLTGDRVIQLLILAWAFSAFLQGVAGFGVPIAVIAPLLIGLGFNPVVAVAAVAIGHSWSVTFGDIASSFQALIAVTGLHGRDLAPWSGAFLGLAAFGCGLGTAHTFGGWRAVRRGAVAILLMGSAMAGMQYLLATNGLWNLAGFVAGLVGLLVGAALARFYTRGETGGSTSSKMGLGLALAAYLVLIVIVSAAELWPWLHDTLRTLKVQVRFPALTTNYGWTTPAGPGKAIPIFGHAGALLLYSSALAYAVYRTTGHYTAGAMRRILTKTVRSAIPSSIGIASMVGMAVMMDHAGMTYRLAQGLSSAMGAAFPLVSSLIGTLGAFMTGSNTNSNVIFAPLQQRTAELIGISVWIILGAQTTGGALGSMLAPAKLIVGCSTAGLSDQEGRVMRKTVVYGLVIAVVVGIVAWTAIYWLGLQ
jgi:lactate permease